MLSVISVRGASACEQLTMARLFAGPAAGGDSTLVGVVTYDSSVHFYNVSKGQAVAQMLVMADVSDVYAPMSSNLLAKLSDAREELAELLSSIPGMFAAASGPESCGTAAVEVSVIGHIITGNCKCCIPAEK